MGWYEIVNNKKLSTFSHCDYLDVNTRLVDTRYICMIFFNGWIVNRSKRVFSSFIWQWRKLGRAVSCRWEENYSKAYSFLDWEAFGCTRNYSSLERLIINTNIFFFTFFFFGGGGASCQMMYSIILHSICILLLPTMSIDPLKCINFLVPENNPLPFLLFWNLMKSLHSRIIECKFQEVIAV